MAFNFARTTQVPLTVFGSLCLETSPVDLPEGVSPDNQDVVFLPGSVGSRPAMQRVFDTALPGNPTVVYGKTFVAPNGTTLNLYFDSNGKYWSEDVFTTPGSYSLLLTSAPGSYCKSITAFGREYIAISDGLHGAECAIQYDGTSLDRVTQDGPGAAPVVSCFSMPSVALLATGGPITIVPTETDPAAQAHPPSGPYTNINLWTNSSTALILPGSQLTLAGYAGTSAGLNGVWTVLAIYAGTPSLIVMAANVPAGTVYFVGASGVTVTVAGGITLSRSQNVVTAYTTSAHGLSVGYQAQISGVAASVVGTSIASIVINNENLPGVATITTATAHGLVPGISVSLNGITAAAVGGAITAIVRAGQIVTVTTTSAHGLAPGALVTIAGNTPATFNTTALVLNVISPTVFTFLQVDVDAVGTAFGTVSVNWPIPNSSTPTYFEVLTAPTFTTFQVAISYSDGSWGAAGTVTYAWAGTFYVTAVPTTTSFQYQQYGPDAVSASAGTVTPYGQIAPGLHQLRVSFLTRNFAITKPSPAVKFTANGGQYASVSQIPIGPPNVIARILQFTGASGAFFFYIPTVPQVNGQIVGTATQINDNSTTALVVDFADSTLYTSIGVSAEGNNLANQTVIEGALGFGFYASRLIAYGQRNRIQNLLNMGFDGGYAPNATTTPAGWTGAGGALQAGHYGVVWQAPASTSLSQGFYQDSYGVPIATPLATYIFRCWCLLLSPTPTITATISSASTGFSSTAAVVAGAAGYHQTAFTLAMPTTIPADIVLTLAVTGGIVQLDDCSIIYAQTPYRDTICFGSYVNNPEAFDGVSGVFGPSDDTRKIMETVTQTVSQQTALYMLTRDPTGRLHKVVNNGTTEPAYWPISQVGSNCGVLSAFATTKSQADDSTASGGEEWFAWASASGARIYDGNQPWKISQENQPLWDSINPVAALTVWAVNDPNARCMYFGLPLIAATAPSMIYPISYRQLDTAYQIAQSPPVHTSYTGRLIATDNTRKSTRWNITANGAALMYRVPNQLSLVLFGGNAQVSGAAAGFGQAYTLNPAKFTDDDYGQIFPYYVTYFFVSHDQEQALQLGAARKMLAYLSAFISGLGTVMITPLCDKVTNPWPIVGVRALTASPSFDLEWAGGSATAQRMAVKIASTPATGTDNWFLLNKLVMGLRVNARLPVRGSST